MREPRNGREGKQNEVEEGKERKTRTKSGEIRREKNNKGKRNPYGKKQVQHIKSFLPWSERHVHNSRTTPLNAATFTAEPGESVGFAFNYTQLTVLGRCIHQQGHEEDHQNVTVLTRIMVAASAPMISPLPQILHNTNLDNFQDF